MVVKRVSREAFGLDGRVTVVNRRLALPRGHVHRNAPEETCLEDRQGTKTAAHSSRPARAFAYGAPYVTSRRKRTFRFPSRATMRAAKIGRPHRKYSSALSVGLFRRTGTIVY